MIDIGSTLVERYELRARLGRGGMGEVYRAWDHELERDVAIKSLLPHLAADPDLVARFRREARALARLRHHGIIALYDILRVPPDQLYLVLEYVPGEPLDRLMARAPMPWSRCVAIGAEVCDALQAAHAEGVVHRDIKPSNILVEAGDRARVADFGLARLAGGAARSGVSITTRTGVVMGTPGYWAPEQALGRTITPQTDLYALGAVLFEAATGRLPHVSEDDGPAAAFIHIAQPVPDPREIAPALSDASAEALMRALAKDPNDRFDSAAAMAVALRSTVGAGRLAQRAAPAETEIAPRAPVALLSDPAMPPPPAPRITPAPTIGPDSPVPGPWSPPPGTLIAAETDAETRPRALPAQVRAERRGKLAALAGIAGLVVVGGIAGQIVGGGDASPTTPSGQRAISAQGLSVSVPPTWTAETPLKPAGLAFTGPSAGAGDPGGNTISVGFIAAEKPTLLPDAFSERLAQAPKAQVVILGAGTEALRYPDLRPQGLADGSTLALTVVPTSKGAATVACVTAVGASRSACDSAAASLTVTQAKIFGLGPDATYAGRLRRVLRGLDTARSAGRTFLAKQALPLQQARAARGVEQIYRAAAKGLVAPATLDPAGVRANRRLVIALNRVANGYAAMATTTDRQDRSGFATASQDVTTAEIDLGSALRAFDDLGYRIG